MTLATAHKTSLKLHPPTPPTLGKKDLISLDHLSSGQVHGLFDLAEEIKAAPAAYAEALAGKSVVLLFEKPSLRTRATFQIGAAKLGADAIYMDHAASRLGEREPVSDYGQNLSLWADAIVARVFRHEVAEALAASASIPVINGLSDLRHPCQALADFMTLREAFGALQGLKLAFVGDGNNVCHSLMIGAAILGVDMLIVCPAGYEPCQSVARKALKLASITGAPLMITDEIDALIGRDAVYTDTWVSMGDEADGVRRRETLQAFQVDETMMSIAGDETAFMHCLPAHRGEEVTTGVLDGPRSLALKQAENRMWIQNALMLSLFGGA